MNTLDNKYLDLCNIILDEGVKKENRTGVDTIATTGLSIRHNMSEGAPLLTTKRMAKKTALVELEGFIHGITSKKWYQDRGCKIWNEWANPTLVEEKISELKDNSELEMTQDYWRKKAQLELDDLGYIYGSQWRHFRDPEAYVEDGPGMGGAMSKDYVGGNYDQLGDVLNKLLNNPDDRRMLVSAWNPLAIHTMALPPCHFAWQAIVVGDRLDLVWYQRSVDFALGLPFNIFSYGTLLHLLAQHANLKEGILTGHLGDCHIYENHIDGIKEQMNREPFELSKYDTDFPGFLHWTHKDTKLVDYKCHDKIVFDVAV